MKKLLLFVSVMFLYTIVQAQDYHEIDSLKEVLSSLPALNSTDRDTSRMKLCLEIGYLYEEINADTALMWYQNITDSILSVDIIKNFPKRSSLIAQALSYMGYVYYNYREFNLSKQYYERSVKISELIGDKRRLSICFYNIGDINYFQCNYQEAAKYMEQSLEIKKELKDNRGISNCLNFLGTLCRLQGDYKGALNYYEGLLKFNEELGNDAGIASALMNLGILLNNQGNNNEATIYIERSLKISEELNDKAAISKCITNLGIVCYDQGKYDEAKKYYQISLKINEGLNDKTGLSSCLNNLGNVSAFQGNFEEAMNYYERSLKIDEELGDKRGISYCLMNIGAVAMAQGNIATAIGYYEHSLQMKEEIGSTADMAADYPTLAKAYLQFGEIEKAKSTYLKSLNLNLGLLQDNFSILSENEKELFLNKTGEVFNYINEFTLLIQNNNDSLIGLCYNNELILKGLLLNSTGAIIEVVNNSNDTALKNTYFRLKQLRNEISFLQGIPVEERDIDIRVLEERANDEERKLVKISTQFADLQKLFTYKWQDVQKTLKPNEAAIEFIEIQHTVFRSQTIKSDSISYAALVLKQGDACPKMIMLCSKDSLALLFGKEADSINNLIAARSVIYKNEVIDFGKCYDLIWKPLEAYLKGIETVTFSPAGLLNQISFAAIRTNNNVLLSEKYNLRTVVSTRALIEQNSEPIGMTNTVLFGGIRYQSDSLLTIELSDWYDSDFGNLLSEFQQHTDDSESTWKYLPGTQVEISKIKKLLDSNTLPNEMYNGYRATEDRFKSFSGNKSPEIIHIASHGFSIPLGDKNDAYMIFENSFVQNYNPLFRTGMLFAGASRTWNKAKPIKGIEDGILTAYEVSSLNLSNTKLVVLSACETGLGEVKGSEGVYGLQRAFKMAGVKYIIMSLWSVPDKETSIFMEIFYENLIKLKDVRLAFDATQKKMRKKYKPFFWAAFVLVE